MNLLFAQASGSNSAIIAFAIYTIVVLGLAVVASRAQRGKSFLAEYFLGSRSLGVWAFALTFAATSASGGSFTGFPSLIYSHGWSLALWIGSYMLVPALMLGLMGKRLNQVARRSGAITIPDVLRDRFDSRRIGMLATVLIILFMAFNLVAQFKAGALILSTLLDDVPLFQSALGPTDRALDGITTLGLDKIDPAYLLCLSFFSISVILYTSYGGFRAVVWTDVLQGIVMVLGVAILLPMTLYQVGGLENATQDLAKMEPPRNRSLVLEREAAGTDLIEIPFGTWLEETTGEQRRVFRVSQRVEVPANRTRAQYMDGDTTLYTIPALEIMSPHEVARIQVPQANVRITQIDDSETYAYGAGQQGVYIQAPGPHPKNPSGFLPFGLAISFFFYWTFSGAGQPSNMVRLMSFDNSRTLRRAMMTVAIYFTMIYFPLVVIFCCGRVLMPGMENESDRIMPALVEHVTGLAGMPWLAGLIVAAPFAAVMSTVDSFLLMISSAIVRDVYQREFNPQASEATLKRLTYAATLLVGVAALIGSLNPPQYLQDIIVFTGGGLSACFLIPVLLALYWPRFNAHGAIACMLGGFFTHAVLHFVGWRLTGEFDPYRILGLDPLIPAWVVSIGVAIVTTRVTKPPSQELVQKYFLR